MKKIKDLEVKNELLMKENEIAQIYKKENEYLKTLINNAGSVIKTSVSALSFVSANFTNAPVLEKLKEYPLLCYDEDYDDDDDEKLLDTLIYNYENGTLANYLGDFIVKAYKKEDPKDQSLWNSDTGRMTYIVRELINKKPDWIVDKKGIKTTKYIIDPLLEYVKTILKEFLDTIKINKRSDSIKEIESKMKKMKSAGEIIHAINEDILSEQINKYMAPHFYLVRNDELITLK